jgi:hypothetical protein
MSDDACSSMENGITFRLLFIQITIVGVAVLAPIRRVLSRRRATRHHHTLAADIDTGRPAYRKRYPLSRHSVQPRAGTSQVRSLG